MEDRRCLHLRSAPRVSHVRTHNIKLEEEHSSQHSLFWRRRSLRTSQLPSPNGYRLAEARMKSVSDVCFSLLFAGSMSPFRGGVEWSADRCRIRGDVQR